MSLLANIVLQKAQNASANDTSKIVHHYSNSIDKYPTFLQMIDELCKDDSVRMMIYATLCGRPALEPVIYKVEAICQGRKDFDIYNNDTAKQSVGVIVKLIMRQYGYEPISEEASPIKNKEILSNTFSYAQVYKQSSF